MNTLSFVEYGDVQSRNESIKSTANLGNFIPPMTIILSVGILLIGFVLASLYFFPLTAVPALVLGALATNKYAKRRQLTFFHDGYSPDIFAEEIDDLCD